MGKDEGQKIKISKGDFLIVEGDSESSNLYYLDSGCMAVMKDTEVYGEGIKKSQIGTIYSGEVVGEMSFLDEGPRCASVMAINDCEVTVIPRENFQATFRKLPSWYHVLVYTLLDRLRRANKKARV